MVTKEECNSHFKECIKSFIKVSIITLITNRILDVILIFIINIVYSFKQSNRNDRISSLLK